MAWSSLAANQMVSFTDAQGGGFPLNSGQSSTTSNQLMTKNDALTKYNLVASNMSSYATNQLVPKSVWVSAIGSMWTINSYTNPNLYFTRNYGSDSSVTVQTSTNNGNTWSDSTGSTTSPRNIGSYSNGTWIRLKSISDSSFSNILVIATVNFITLGYSALNGMGGFDTNFNTARTVGASNDQTTGGVAGCAKISTSYEVDRMFMGFNTTPLVSVTNAGIQVGLDNNQITADPIQFVVVKTNSVFASNHAWVHADYNEGNGGTIVSDIVAVNKGQTGIVQFPFNSVGLNYVNSNNSATFVILQYANDYNNVAPTLSNNYIFSYNSNMKLYYY